jgi:beta-1,4-glucosyltransferase
MTVTEGSEMQQEVYTGPERRWKPRYLSVGPVSLPYVSREKALQTIRRSFEDRQQINVAFCNANTMLKAFQSKDYAAQLERFLILNDGIGVDLCSMIFSGERFPENLNGTDFVPDLLDHRDRNLRVFLLGSKQGIAEQAASRLIFPAGRDRHHSPRHQ